MFSDLFLNLFYFIVTDVLNALQKTWSRERLRFLTFRKLQKWYRSALQLKKIINLLILKLL